MYLNVQVFHSLSCNKFTRFLSAFHISYWHYAYGFISRKGSLSNGYSGIGVGALGNRDGLTASSVCVASVKVDNTVGGYDNGRSFQGSELKLKRKRKQIVAVIAMENRCAQSSNGDKGAAGAPYVH